MQRIFEALASSVRRQILAYLSHAEMSAGDIASRFNLAKPSISQHLSILEAAGLVESERRGQFVFYRLVQDNLVNTLDAYVQQVCPVRRPIHKESAERAGTAGNAGAGKPARPR